MKQLTVFTTTYNRAYSLPQLYESLCRQSNQDFEWLVVDDGSTDNTKEIIKEWINESKIKITYIYQKNQGMHGGHNTAYKNIVTPWNTCIDSDDYMPDNAVEVILNNIGNLSDKFAGIVGLDIDKKGEIIGTNIPEDLTECTLSDLYNVYKVKGDKKLVYKTEIVRKYPPYPLFEGENFVPLGYLYTLIDQDYLLKPINEPLVVVEYQPDGSSMNILKQYRRNPRGFAFSRRNSLKIGFGFKRDLKNMTHLVSSALFVKNFSLLKNMKRPFLLILAFPLGVILNIYIRCKTGRL